jgi:acyl-CoA thioesterase-1
MAGLTWEVFFMLTQSSQPRSYGKKAAPVQRAAWLVVVTLMWLAFLAPAESAARPLQIVALGDSLTAGLGLPAGAAFPARLEGALRAKGYDVSVVNAGVSGDTASGGLARLDWSVPEGTNAVILELGANDALRGVDPKITKAALDQILARLGARHIPVLLAGMRAPPNMGPDFVRAFEAIFPALASTHRVVFYRFFLEGVVTNTSLNQFDGMHPNAAGVDVIVRRILPSVEKLISRARTARAS